VGKISKLSKVVDWRLCVGCGACAYVCPSQAVRLHDFLEEGIRPIVDEQHCSSCQDCLKVCPGVESDFRPDVSAQRALDQPTMPLRTFEKEWGPVLEIWEGFATDPEIRFKGSSGGLLTALAAYCVEKGAMHGVLHIGQDPQDPLRNRTRLSRSRDEILAACGSRYAPASVCDRLAEVESAPSPCAVIGKPSEIVAVRKAERLRPELAKKVGVTFSFFCAESPSTAGTLALLQQMGFKPDSIENLRYRGHGWPGHFAPTQKGESEPTRKLTYFESWAFLQRFRPWAAQMWPDGTGELADISCGDPWYEKVDGENPGFSLVVVRTPRGRALLQAAIAAGYVQLKRADEWKLARSQDNLLRKKGAIWGRLWVLKLLGVPTTSYPGFHLWHCWKGLPWREKLRSTVGTLRRVLSRKLYRPLVLGQKTAASSEAADIVPVGRIE